jgi:PBSX family phage terminase large subunit
MLVEKFLIDDNTFLDPEYVRALKSEYQGVFYRRFIEGAWCIADGLVYSFDEHASVVDELPDLSLCRFFVSIDYGTQNPCSMGLWAFDEDSGVAYRISEYYYSGRANRAQKTDEEYYTELETLAGELYIEYVVVDPSAASFIETIRRHGRFTVRKAVNDVLPGIRTVAAMLQRGRLKIHRGCKDAIREFGLYSWDSKASEDAVVKDNDHAMDEIRYFVMTILRRELRWEEW